MAVLPRRQQNRADRERRLLDAALSVFASQGYAATTMDLVAREARLTKPTLYSYFPSKDALFQAMMQQARDRMLHGFDPGFQGALVDDLWSFAWAYADTVMRPDMLSFARLIIGETARFPGLGPAYQAAGPDQVLRGLMTHLARRRDEGRLDFADAELAAQDFWGLILSAPRTAALHDPGLSPARRDLARYVHNGLRIFLKAYSTEPAADLARLDNLISSQPDQG